MSKLPAKHKEPKPKKPPVVAAYLKLSEVAKRLGMSAEHVRRLTVKARPDGSPVLRSADFAVGSKRQLRVKIEWLDAFIAEREAEARSHVVQPSPLGRPPKQTERNLVRA
jgi:hypothetical protein